MWGVDTLPATAKFNLTGWPYRMLEYGLFDQVEEEILARVHPMNGEEMPLRWCYFRYLSGDVRSGGSLPPFTLVINDGFAVIAHDLANARPESPVTLEVIESIISGQHSTKRITHGKCASVESGAQLPRGADAVFEFSKVTQRLESAVFTESITPGLGISEQDSVIRPGALVMRKGDYLTPARVGILSALGLEKTPIIRPPVIGIVSTGNELVPSDTEKLKAGQIRDANTHMLSAKLTEMRLPQMSLGVIPDSRNALVDEIGRVIRQVDGLIVTGGKVKGRKRFLEETVESYGELIISGVRMIPGGSFSFGIFEGKLVFALPGSPPDALLTFDILVKPAILKMMGARDYRQPLRSGVLSGSLNVNCDRDSFIWARFEVGDDRTFRVIPLSESSDVNLAETIRASCVIRLAPGRYRIMNGDQVSFIATSPDRLLTPPMFTPEAGETGHPSIGLNFDVDEPSATSDSE